MTRYLPGEERKGGTGAMSRQNAALLADVNRLTTALEKAEALSWEMCPEDGRRLRERLG